ncbi:MAG: acetyl-CoA hydrolase/transferase C-terminal domain-containing protein [Dehalococcoidia bacterium]
MTEATCCASVPHVIVARTRLFLMQWDIHNALWTILATEHGVADLKGQSTKEKALDIISIAHPNFRDDLLREAEDMYLI